MARLVIVSNRVPPPRERGQLAGGLAVALRDAIAGRDVLWFGWSGVVREEASRVHQARSGRVRFATIDLTQRQHTGFYTGFSNGTLWPLLHWRLGLAAFRREDYAAYREVNELFATVLMRQLQPGDLVWAHDYHLFPLGAALRARGWTGRLGFFLHVPFPPGPLFRMLPQSDELLRDMEAYDVLGMQTREDARYLNSALSEVGVKSRATAFPISIDPDDFAATAERAERGDDVQRMRASMGERALILGIDRLDYTKGLPQRFRAFDQLLRRFPEHRNEVTFLQVAPVSRGDVAQYRSLRRELDELAGRINGEHAEFDWMPLRYITRAMPRATLAGFLRISRVGLVTPLRDGMNLVAKEFVAAQHVQDPGALVLSCFAGASEELEGGALLVNPYDPDAIAEALDVALRMELEERQARWQAMRDKVWRNTAASWSRAFIKRLEG